MDFLYVYDVCLLWQHDVTLRVYESYVLRTFYSVSNQISWCLQAGPYFLAVSTVLFHCLNQIIVLCWKMTYCLLGIQHLTLSEHKSYMYTQTLWYQSSKKNVCWVYLSELVLLRLCHFCHFRVTFIFSYSLVNNACCITLFTLLINIYLTSKTHKK